MAPAHETVTVVDLDGIQGALELDGRLPTDPDAQVLVRFPRGAPVLAPVRLLQSAEEGLYRLPLRWDELRQAAASGGPLVIPVIEEQVRVERRTTETGVVRIAKTVEEWVEAVDEPTVQETVEIERTAVNRPVDGPEEARYEGDTLVIPLLEEVLVVEKRLIVREEVRIRKRRTESRTPQEVTLRREDVHVERTKPPAEPSGPQAS